MRKAVLIIVAAVFLILAMSGAALAASSEDIYADYAADQKLDGTYTDADLQAFLDNAVTLQYADPTVVAGLTTVITAMLNDDPQDPPSEDQSSGRDTFPFTGSELISIAIAALALVGAGIGLRRTSRSRA